MPTVATIEDGVYLRLAADAPILVIGATGWPVEAVQSQPMPLYTYSEADQRTTMLLNGTLEGLNVWDMDIDCYAADYVTCKLLRKAIKASLVGFSGALPNGIVVRGIFDSGGGGDGAEPPIFADELGTYKASCSFAVNYEE